MTEVRVEYCEKLCDHQGPSKKHRTQSMRNHGSKQNAAWHSRHWRLPSVGLKLGKPVTAGIVITRKPGQNDLLPAKDTVNWVVVPHVLPMPTVRLQSSSPVSHTLLPRPIPS